MLHPEPVHLTCEFLAEFFEQVLAQQLLLKRVEHPRLHVVAANCQVVVAAALISSSKAGEPVAPSHDESRAADAALRQTREQVLRPLRSADGARCLHRMPCVLLTRLRSRPDVVPAQSEVAAPRATSTRMSG